MTSGSPPAAPASASDDQPQWPNYGRLDGPVVIVGFGSIGRATLPLIERHFTVATSQIVVVTPDTANDEILAARGIRKITVPITPDNYIEILTPLLTAGPGRAFCVNLSVDTSSLAILRLTRELGALYIDTVVEPWLGFYYDESTPAGDRSNYSLRESVLAERRANPGGATAVSACGANPGMVSWFVKQALLDIARETGVFNDVPATREQWAELMQTVGVKGVHVAERDTQRAARPKERGTFVNTWSVEGFLSEGQQPAELGWGTHERWEPANACHHSQGCRAAIYLLQPGGNTRVRSWCPTPGAQFGFLVTHNEAISIADYFTVAGGDGDAVYRPTVHYAYHPSDDAVLSLDELFGHPGRVQARQHILGEDEIIDGIDELGVLLYGHEKNAYWFGSQLSIEQARSLAPYQNATGMQVSSAVLAGMVWALENPNAGIVESEDMDFQRCLEVQRPYLGPVVGVYTDWTPLVGRAGLFPEDVDESDPWQFRNVLVH
jgi:homospermidine synthase